MKSVGTLPNLQKLMLSLDSSVYFDEDFMKYIGCNICKLSNLREL